MEIEIIISILGAFSAITVSLLGAILANRNSNLLQLRKLKEDHYVSYIESLHTLAALNDEESISKYTYFRDKLLIVGSEEVVKSILEYESKGATKDATHHDELFTKIIIAIRKDLKIKDKSFPDVTLKK